MPVTILANRETYIKYRYTIMFRLQNILACYDPGRDAKQLDCNLRASTSLKSLRRTRLTIHLTVAPVLVDKRKSTSVQIYVA